MTDLNTLIIHGRIVRNAEYTTTDTGLTVTRFTLASNRAIKLQNGEWADDTTFFPLVLFDKRAVGLGPYLRKGRGVTIRGHLRQYQWEKDGEKRTGLRIVVDNVLFDLTVSKGEKSRDPHGQDTSMQNAEKDVQLVQQPENMDEDFPYINEEDFYTGAELDFPPPDEIDNIEI